MTKLSVVMPVFNQGQYLAAAVNSILRQSLKDFELLILDDGSTDDSLKIASQFKDQRIRLFKNQSSQGLAKGLNLLISRAKGRYIARMDGDDLSGLDRLEKQTAFLEAHPQTALLGSWAKVIDGQNRLIAEFRRPVGGKEIRRTILVDNPFIHPSVMFRRAVWQELGGYREQFLYSQDYDFFLRIVGRYRSANLPEFLLKFRWQPDFIKQKAQHRYGLQARWQAVVSPDYGLWELVKLVPAGLKYLVPAAVKRWYWRQRFKAGGKDVDEKV